MILSLHQIYFKLKDIRSHYNNKNKILLFICFGHKVTNVSDQTANIKYFSIKFYKWTKTNLCVFVLKVVPPWCESSQRRFVHMQRWCHCIHWAHLWAKHKRIKNLYMHSIIFILTDLFKRTLHDLLGAGVVNLLLGGVGWKHAIKRIRLPLQRS